MIQTSNHSPNTCLVATVVVLAVVASINQLNCGSASLPAKQALVQDIHNDHASNKKVDVAVEHISCASQDIAPVISDATSAQENQALDTSVVNSSDIIQGESSIPVFTEIRIIQDENTQIHQYTFTFDDEPQSAAEDVIEDEAKSFVGLEGSASIEQVLAATAQSDSASEFTQAEGASEKVAETTVDIADSVSAVEHLLQADEADEVGNNINVDTDVTDTAPLNDHHELAAGQLPPDGDHFNSLEDPTLLQSVVDLTSEAHAAKVADQAHHADQDAAADAGTPHAQGTTVSNLDNEEPFGAGTVSHAFADASASSTDPQVAVEEVPANPVLVDFNEPTQSMNYQDEMEGVEVQTSNSGTNLSVLDIDSGDVVTSGAVAESFVASGLGVSVDHV